MIKKLICVLVIVILFIVFFPISNYKSSIYSWHMSIMGDKNVIKRLGKMNSNTLYQDFSSDYLKGKNSEFIKYMNDNNIDVYHLSGDPSWGIDKVYLAKKEVDKVLEFNHNNSGKIKGIVFDIESYSLDEFDKDGYLKSLKEIYSYANKNKLYLILCIPSWFDKYGDKYLEDIIKYAGDEFSIMNYNIEKTLSGIENEAMISYKYGKKISTIYELDFSDKKHFSNFNEIMNDYKKIKKKYGNVGLSFHHYDDIID